MSEQSGSQQGAGEERLVQGVQQLGLTAEDQTKAMDLARFLVRVGTTDVSKLAASRPGDTVCNQHC